jgi:transcription-repair coupling factor (superfamily II helicase)
MDKAALQTAAVNLSVGGPIPDRYVPDPAVRLNLYARLLCTVSVEGIDDLDAEFDERLGEFP